MKQIAVADPREAVRLAQQIEDPWYRCQALAFAAAGHRDQRATTRLLKSAFAAATETSDLNRVVSVSAWPLKVLCRLGNAKTLAAETQRLLQLARQLESPVRRADALNLVLGAVVSGPRPLFLQVLDSFKAACGATRQNGKRNRKGESLLVPWVVIVHRLDPSISEDLLRLLSTEEMRTRAKTQRAENGHLDLDALCPWPSI